MQNNVELRGQRVGMEIKQSGEACFPYGIFYEGSGMLGGDSFTVILFKTGEGNIFELAKRPDSAVDLYLRGIRPSNPDLNPDQRGVTLINLKGSIREDRLDILSLDLDDFAQQVLRVGSPFLYQYMGGWQGRTHAVSEIVLTNMRVYSPDFLRQGRYRYNKIVDELLLGLTQFKEIPESYI